MFMNQPVDEVNRLAAESGIDIVQLHGDEDNTYMEAVSKPVMKVVHVPAGTTVDMVPNALTHTRARAHTHWFSLSSLKEWKGTCSCCERGLIPAGLTN